MSEAHSSITAFIRANGTLTSDSFVISKASTLAALSIANTLIGALNHRMSVVRVYYFTNPCLGPMRRKT